MIEFDHVSFGYGAKKVFENLQLAIPLGKIVGLLGPNGSGKSTLCYMMAGLIWPRKGDVRVDQMLPSSRSSSLLREIILVPESSRMYPLALKYLPELMGSFYPRFDSVFFAELCDAFNLPWDGVMSRMAHGQQKKVMLAFAFAARTRTLVFDEPLNGLDVNGQRAFRQALLRGHEYGNTVIFSTHLVRSMENLFEHVVVVNQGKLLVNCSLKELGSRFTIRENEEMPTPSDLYWEDLPFGRQYLSLRKPGDKNVTFDLEFFYNAAIANTSGIQKALETPWENQA